MKWFMFMAMVILSGCAQSQKKTDCKVQIIGNDVHNQYERICK